MVEFYSEASGDGDAAPPPRGVRRGRSVGGALSAGGVADGGGGLVTTEGRGVVLGRALGDAPGEALGDAPGAGDEVGASLGVNSAW